jgi:hypothetical protein
MDNFVCLPYAIVADDEDGKEARKKEVKKLFN